MSSRYIYTCVKAGHYKIGRFDDGGNRLPFIIKVEVEDHNWQIFKNVYEVVTWNGGVDIYFNEEGNFDSLSFVTHSWSITFEEEDDKNEDNSTGKEN